MKKTEVDLNRFESEMGLVERFWNGKEGLPLHKVSTPFSYRVIFVRNDRWRMDLTAKHRHQL